MTTSEQIKTLLSTAHDLMLRAADEPDLAERLLKEPHATISQQAGCDFPNGLHVTAVVDDEGSLQMAASIDPDFEGEPDDELMARVAGGRHMYTPSEWEARFLSW